MRIAARQILPYFPAFSYLYFPDFSSSCMIVYVYSGRRFYFLPQIPTFFFSTFVPPLAYFLVSRRPRPSLSRRCKCIHHSFASPCIPHTCTTTTITLWAVQHAPLPAAKHMHTTTKITQTADMQLRFIHIFLQKYHIPIMMDHKILS